ncbi:hypothetical protein DFH11DRAFT_1506897 [Phellopilus nigrolimitatus]|nr:hypothetical protein DFH11DRAFT_1506897 [Phellopilus nigrolimitatus]
MSPPGYFRNDLKPLSLDTKSLQRALVDLQIAIAASANSLKHFSGVPTNRVDKSDSLYTGNSGIALMFLRIAVQYEAAGLESCLGTEFQSQIPSIIRELLPPLQVHRPTGRHLSPLDTTVGPGLVYILSSLSYPSTALSGKTSSNNESGDVNWTASAKTLREAARVAAEDDEIGDEVLYGRAGLLWGMLNLQVWLEEDARVPTPRRNDVKRIAGDALIEEIVNELFEAGDTGAQIYTRSSGETGLPLMWNWHGKFYLGAIHGVSGILTVLLQAPRKIIKPHLHQISSCINALCDLSSRNNGHLPSSLPAVSRTHHLVQICHGSPGFLLLLATFRARFPQEWRSGWDAGEALASENVWKEGLVTKGLGVCHGVAGNAWPWLLNAHAKRGTPEADISLSRALAFLLHARELPPLATPSAHTSPYRTPDHPYSLFEGLAGTVCAWVDACVIIRERLAETGENRPGGDRPRGPVLGIPGLGGASAHGIL